MVLLLGRRQRQYQRQTRCLKANQTKRMKLFRQLRSQLGARHRDALTVLRSDIEERSVKNALASFI